MLAFNKEEVTIQRRYVRDGQEHLTAVDDVTQHPRITHVPDNLGEYATGLNLHTEFLSKESESAEIKTDDVDQFHTEGGINPAKAAAQSDRIYEEYKRYIEGAWKRNLSSAQENQRRKESAADRTQKLKERYPTEEEKRLRDWKIKMMFRSVGLSESDIEKVLVNRSSGNPATHGGSPAVRNPYRTLPDDPATENDESNDQPLGFFGSMTIHAMYLGSNNQYALDADVFGSNLERLYFVKGGWVDFYDCQLAGDFSGICVDENGNQWTFLGPWN